MGLAASTSRVPTTEPTIFIFWALPTLTPSARPMESAKREVSVAVRRTPPFATKFWRFATPSQPRPGRMSSVESFLPTRFGVSGGFFHGAGLPQALGRPLLMVAGPEQKPTGGNRVRYSLAMGALALASPGVLRESG